ncbi:DNA internalization-related competence protein ComEC/Rec2 [Rhodanobacter sp. DHG33]|uniref:DNA internalization-related competence protein ComEC/Rec2 n=1 Tax=Rhodanobacter sp. DHG33 TaxID=2775921 RepID=UPI00177DCFFE|nr:DNA internalization-related competence protein ComEC/Rec2 [Rhodanobacter sp. DHG33]MBD8899840.1 DNA internalization-related competence protein ComEC/Rec2 [Rhodanobacter sp. DHG33]
MALAFDKPLAATLAAPALLLGVLLVQWLPVLPPRWLSMLTMLPVITAFWRWPRWRLPLCCCAGALWAMVWGAGAMDARLPRDLEGRDFVVTGRVVELPLLREDATRFVLYVDSATLDGKAAFLRGRVTVSWYNDAPPIAPCERWRLQLRLRRPRSLLGPGAPDGERMALQRRLVATGYVREDAANGRLGRAAWCVDGVREAVARGIAARVDDPHDAALLQAFSVGDTRGLDQDDWEVARANGIPHLISISGFHVGVVAMIGAWLPGALYLLWPGLALRLPRVQMQAASALLMAAMYSTLAGLGLPTVRTLLMIAVVALARCSRRGGSGAHSLALAMIAILAFDPLAVLAAGFWLSFTGVALLMLCLQSRERGLRAFLRELTAGQLLMTVSLLPLTLWFFGEASLVGALSNLVAVPFVSFVVVPCALLGTVLLGLCPSWATPVLWLAAKLAHAQWWLLEHMATWPGAHWYLPEVQPWALLLATLGALWLFLPRGMPLRALGLLLFLPLLWPPLPQPAAGAFEAWVLDVGQGLSVLLRTRHHALLYDTGARYPSGYDLGEAAVLPAIRALGIARLDMLMVSHADNDHAGGADGVVAAFPQALRYAGEPGRMSVPMQACMAGQAWTWDGVRFRVLHPAANVGDRDNDRSCVLLVEGAGGALLLTGDISSKAEPAVADALGESPSPVLLVPHHGSKASSGADFIDAVAPPLAVVSAGWRNRFGHPKPEVLARYAAAGVPVLNTADGGTIALDFPADGPTRVMAQWRLRAPRYWRERP